MQIDKEELDELVVRATQALEEFYSVVADLDNKYNATEQEDGTPVDIALFHTLGNSDDVRDVIAGAIETAGKPIKESEDNGDNWKYN